MVTNYKPTIFSQRHDQTGVWTDLPMLHTGSTGQAVHCVEVNRSGPAYCSCLSMESCEKIEKIIIIKHHSQLWKKLLSGYDRDGCS